MSLFIETVISSLSLSLSIRLSAQPWLEPFPLVHVNSLKCWKLEIPNENLTIGANQAMLYYNINTTWICRSMGLQKEATKKKKQKALDLLPPFTKWRTHGIFFHIFLRKHNVMCVSLSSSAVNIFYELFSVCGNFLARVTVVGGFLKKDFVL